MTAFQANAFQGDAHQVGTTGGAVITTIVHVLTGPFRVLFNGLFG